MAPTEAAEMLPYLVVNCEALSPANCSIARRSFRSSSGNPLSSASLNTIASTPCCVALRPNSRPSSKGPRSEMVARTGTPRLPNTSQNATGLAANAGASNPIAFSRSASFGDIAPAAATPDRSPLTSAMKTGTPIREKCSASTCSVTVLPVPVAPVMRP